MTPLEEDRAESQLMAAAPHTVGSTPRYAYDGQTVWAFSRKDRLWVVCTVVCAVGTMARVVNEGLGLDRWCPLINLFLFVEPSLTGDIAMTFTPYELTLLRESCAKYVNYLDDTARLLSTLAQADPQNYGHGAPVANKTAEKAKHVAALIVKLLTETP